MSEHLLQHGIQLVLNSAGDMEISIFTQQDNDACKFTHRVWNQLNDIWFSHYWTFKEDTQGPTLMSQDNMQEDLVQWFMQQPKELFADGTCQLVDCCYSCLITCGNFFCCKTFTCGDSAVHTSHKTMKKVVWIWSFHCTLTC